MASAGILTTLNIIIIGESHVGKSCLLLRFVDDEYDELNACTTIGVDFKTKTIPIGDNMVKLNIWDTAGLERYTSLSPMFFRKAHGVIFVYDVCNCASFVKVQDWLKEVDLYASTNILKMLVGNKIDKDEREVMRKKGESFANKSGMLFIEASAKTREGVQCAFIELVEKIVETPGLWQASDDSVVRLQREQGQKNRCCWFWYRSK